MEQLGKYGFLRRDYLENHRTSAYQVLWRELEEGMYNSRDEKDWEVCVLENLCGKIYIREICKLEFCFRWPEWKSLPLRLFSQALRDIKRILF